MSDDATDPVSPLNSSKSMWVAVGLIFGLMAIAWFFMFSLSAENPVESVPLEHVQAEPEPGR